MPEPTDVTINGARFMLVAGRGAHRVGGASGYERSVEQPVPARAGRMSLSTFQAGLGWVQDDQIPDGAGGGGWAGEGVHSVAGGAGLEPWPRLISYADANLTDLPAVASRCTGLVAANQVFLHVGRRLYRTVDLDAATWGDLTPVVTMATQTILDLAYYRDDVLILSGPGTNILRWDTSHAINSAWRPGEEGNVGQGYHGVMLYSKTTANLQEKLYFGLSRFNGDPELTATWLDSPIVRMGLFAGKAAIATKQSLYLLSGSPYEGVPGDGGGTARWDGPVEPLFSHGAWVNQNAGDFVFLLSLQGRLYTWLAGSVVEYDPGDGREGWRRVGPGGRLCTGACVAAGHLVVALETAAGQAEVWAFDGFGWWRLARGPAPGACWPVALNGAGGYDLLLLTAGVTQYQLGRLAARSATAPSYALDGTWTSPLLAAGNADTTKAWRKVAAYFAWPEPPGNAGSADPVTIGLDYSVDAGATWIEVDSASVTMSHTQQLELEFSTPPASRLLQLRVRWESVADWAPILTRLVVDYATLDTSPRRRTWTLKVAAGDTTAGRDGAALDLSGREQIDALWAAWRDQTTVTFRDIDFDSDPVERTVRVLDMAEITPRPGDAGRWGEGVVAVTLGEV